VRAGMPADTEHGRALLRRVAPLLLERLKRLEEAPSMVRFLFGASEPDDKARKVLEGGSDYLADVAGALESIGEWTTGAIETALRDLADKRDLNARKAFQPVRAAVTGTLVSPPLFESLEILGRDETVARLRASART
jgi:glutamyl-tRNA synthetase